MRTTHNCSRRLERKHELGEVLPNDGILRLFHVFEEAELGVKTHLPCSGIRLFGELLRRVCHHVYEIGCTFEVLIGAYTKRVS